MYVFRNSIGLRQHHRLMGTFDNIDFGNGGSGNSNPNDAPNNNPSDAPDINDGKPAVTDINDDKPNDKPDGDKPNDDTPKDGDNPNPSTGAVEPGMNVEFDGQKYTVADNGDLVDKDGNVFKEGKDVQAWLDTLNVETDDDDTAFDIKSIQKALGTEILDDKGKPVEFTNDAAGIKSYVQSVIDLQANDIRQAAVNKVFQDNPLLGQFIDYVQLNGTARGFGDLPDRTGIELDDKNEEQQIAIIKMAAHEFGNTTLNDNYIAYLKQSGGLLDEAKAQLQNLQNADKQRNDEMTKQAEEQRQQEIAETQAYWNGVNNRIKGRNIGGYTIPDTFVRTVNGQKVTTTPDDFFDYLYRQVEDKDGNRMSGYQHDLNNLTDEQLLDKELIDAWLMFTGGTYKDLVNMAIREKEVKTLKLTAKNNKGHQTVRITKPTNANGKVNLDDITLS